MEKITYIKISVAFITFFLLGSIGWAPAHAAYSYGNSGGGTLESNYFSGLTIGPIEQYVNGAVNTLQAWIKNNDNQTKVISMTTGTCRCQEHEGFPFRSGLGQCQYYWQPDSNPSRPPCKTTTENITLQPNASTLLSKSVTQVNNQSCGSFQVDFTINKINGLDPVVLYPFVGPWGASFANLQNDCPSPAPAATPACSTDSDCGTNSFVGNNFCQSGNVYRNFRTFTCNNPGTATASCSNATVPQLQQTCNANQMCSNGACISQNNLSASCNAVPNPAQSNQQINFIPSVNGGTGNYTYYWTGACTGFNSTCSNVLNQSSTEFLTVVSGSQSFSTACSVTINNNNVCNLNAFERCVGNNLYWFDSCNNQGNLAQACYGNQICSNNACINQGQTTLSVTKQVRNLSTGNLTWSNSVSASPSDIVQFNVIIQANANQFINNVTVKDVLPANLFYKNNLTLDGVANALDITSGMNIGSISAGQTRTITYQAQVAPSQNFSSGTTTLTNYVTATSSDQGINPATASASVIVTKTIVYGATSVSTGLTNNFFVDSFFLPLVLALIGLWLFNSNLFGISTWIFKGKMKRKDLTIQMQLQKKILEIKRKETIT